jgi:hypothetical protein
VLSLLKSALLNALRYAFSQRAVIARAAVLRDRWSVVKVAVGGLYLAFGSLTGDFSGDTF